MLSGELAAVLTTLIWSVGVFPFTAATARWGAHAVNFFRLVAAVILLAVTLLFYYGFTPVELFVLPEPQQWLWLGMSGIIGLTVGDYFAFRSFHLLGPRLSTAFTTLSPIAAFFFALLFVHEDINIWGIIGMTITVGALVLLSLSKNDATLNNIPEHEKKLGLLFAVLAPICQGIGLVMSRKAFLETESFELMPMHAAWIRMLVGALSLYAFSLVTGTIKEPHRIIFTNRNKGLLPALGGAFFGPYLGMIFSMYAISLIDASVAQTIFGQVPVVVLLLAAWWHKERISWFSILVTLLSIGGVVMMVWRDDIQKLLFPH